MIKNILASVFAFYQLTQGNRLLLQVGIPADTTTAAPLVGPPGWVPVTLPPAAAQPSTIVECLLDNLNPAGCAGRQTVINNAATNFKFKCGARGACAQAEIIFNFENSHAERVEQIQFSEEYAGYQATITIDSTLSAVKQYIDKFECKAHGACEGTTIQLIGGASINDVDCPYPSFCTNCNIKECEWVVAAEVRTLACGTPKACFFH
jgi:hypothetical protein